MGASPPPGLQPHRIQRLAKPNLIRTLKPFTGGTGLLVAGRTYHASMELDDDYDAIRVLFRGDQVAGVVFDRVIIAPSAVTGSVALDTAGAAVTWTDVTYPASQALGAPPITAQGTDLAHTTGTSASSTLIAWTASDWVRMSSIARTDGGIFPLLMLRAYSAATALRLIQGPETTGTDWSALPAEQLRHFLTYQATADRVTTAQGTTTGWTATARGPFAIQYLARSSRGGTVLGVGDSQTQGLGAGNRFNSWGWRACTALSRYSQSNNRAPVTWACEAVQGTSSTTYCYNGKNAIDALRPSVMTIQASSTNDGTTAAAGLTAFRRAMELADYAQSLGIVVILVSPYPSPTASASTEAVLPLWRKAVESGFLGLNFYDAVAASSSTFKLGLSDDGIHCNDTGVDICKAIAMPVFARALGI